MKCDVYYGIKHLDKQRGGKSKIRKSRQELGILAN